MTLTFQEKLEQSNQPVSNYFLTIPCAWTAELSSKTKVDSLTLDMQHGLIDYATMVQMLQAISGSGVFPMVRLQWNEPSIIMKALDAGASGLICPMINNRAEAEAFVRACYYPPKGDRSYGPIRAGLYIDDYLRQAEKEVLPFAMIETAQAVKNLEEIAKTPGLKGLYVGPNDLSISLQRPTRVDFEDVEFVQLLKQVVAVCKSNKLVAGIYASNFSSMNIVKEMGYQLISYGDDTGMYREITQQRVAAMKKIFEGKSEDQNLQKFKPY